MRKMNVLEEQHDEIVMLVRKIAASLSGANISTQADLIASQLEELTSKLAVHLALEDLLVCRPMIQSQNVSLKSTAAKFRGDITCLQDICLNFAENWQAGDIRSRPQEFVQAFKAVASMLVGRFELELRQVYPLAAGRVAG